MRTSALAFALLLGGTLSAGSASACSDAGPPNDACNEGGAAWISCDVHADCPTGQSCHERGFCICGDCTYGETCDSAGCQCAPQAEPTPPSGCSSVQDSCGMWSVVCPEDAGPGPMCTTDGAIPRSCTDDADCGSGYVCGSSGFCECPTPGTSGTGGSSSGGCAAAPGGSAPGAALVLAMLGAFVYRRRRAR
ncbi:MAG: hypothetical protein KC619_22930 [Myxococcales bacterium]|nr:hypothetical protein [Myxococcales bacterium]